MYAQIIFSQHIGRILRYHERKVENKQAQLILAGNAVKDLDHLDRSDKLYHFQRLNVRNDNIAKNTLHIILSFYRSEELSNAKMQTISCEFIREMRLAGQPFLVYRHFDTLNPHMHIICSAVSKNGRKIKFTKAAYYEAKKITKELEKKHALLPSGIKPSNEERIRHQPLQKIVYGTTPIYPTVTNIINTILDNYRFTSLPEFNALLGLYNVQAYRGKKDSFLYQHRGLIYKPVKENGKLSAITIKASDLPCRPTLDNLEKKFLTHRYDTFRQLHQKRITEAIDNTVPDSSLTLAGFKTALANQRIGTIIQKDNTGVVQNIFYIDHPSGSVFEAASLGTRYTAAAILERCRLPDSSTDLSRIREENRMQEEKLTQEQKLTQQPQQKSQRHRPRI